MSEFRGHQRPDGGVVSRNRLVDRRDRGRCSRLINRDLVVNSASRVWMSPYQKRGPASVVPTSESGSESSTFAPERSCSSARSITGTESPCRPSEWWGARTRRSAQRDLSRSRIGRPPAVPKDLIPHGKNSAGRPAATTIFGRFAGAVATHVRGRIAAYEIGTSQTPRSCRCPTQARCTCTPCATETRRARIRTTPWGSAGPTAREAGLHRARGQRATWQCRCPAA